MDGGLFRGAGGGYRAMVMPVMIMIPFALFAGGEQGHAGGSHGKYS